MWRFPSSTVAAPFTPGNVVVQQGDNGSSSRIPRLRCWKSIRTPVRRSAPGAKHPAAGGKREQRSHPGPSFAHQCQGRHHGLSSPPPTMGPCLPVVAANAFSNTDFTQSTAADIDNRSVVTLGASGNITFQAYYTGNGGVPSTGNQARSATSLDNSLWFVADKGGIYTTSAASPAATTADSTANMLVYRQRASAARSMVFPHPPRPRHRS